MSKRKAIPDVMSQLQGLGGPPPAPVEEVVEEVVQAVARGNGSWTVTLI